MEQKHEQQVTVNKEITGKVLMIEKQLMEEKRMRVEAEKKLSSVLPAAGPSPRDDGFYERLLNQ